MSDTRKILRAFLASPSDLPEERKAVRSAVDEFNESLAEAFGYQVELIGWEEIGPGFGRPQQLINQELKKCDLFIGIIWKKWGTPPDHDGEYSSGFHEEFQESVQRREQNGEPEIALFFKNIPEEFMADPGDDLKKVLEFRNTIESEKKILFQNFSTAQEMEALARKCVTTYVKRAKEKDSSAKPDEIKVKNVDVEPDQVRNGKKGLEASPLSAEGYAFLKSLVRRIGQENALDSLDAPDIARFRLLANLISKPGNQNLHLGAHDINILFLEHTREMDLGRKEIICLARLGLQHLKNENVPFWHWYSILSDSQFGVILVSSISGANDDEKIGAITVLSTLEFALPTNENIARERVLSSWFSENSPAVRFAALDYLAKVGTEEDYSVVKNEYEKNDSGTFHKALECMLSILFRTKQEQEAQQLALQAQFESLTPNVLQTVLESLENMETGSLLIGLEHHNSHMRLRTLKILFERNELSREIAERLCKDNDALIRNMAIRALSDLGKSLSQEEVKQILVAPKAQPNYSLLGMASDRKGQELFAQYELEKLKELSEIELTEKIEVNLMYEQAPYFARAEKYFSKYAEELRHDVDETFQTYFEERMRRIEVTLLGLPGVEEMIKKNRDLEDFHRRGLTRQGLNILCEASEYQDLHRIRKNLNSGYVEMSKVDAAYLAEHGEWTDIPLLAKTDTPGPSESWAIPVNQIDFQLEIAKAILNMSREHDISDLFALEMSITILEKVIRLCPEPRFLNISDDALLQLLDHGSADIRKTASIRVIRVFTSERIKSTLYSYINRDKPRYYNVIHWLDLGMSMSTEEVEKVVCATTN